MKIIKDDWRLTNQEEYLYQAKLKKVTFQKSKHSDHEHCEFCMEKFGENEGTLRSGYCTLDNYRWICEKCFHDFKDLFEWQINDN